MKHWIYTPAVKFTRVALLGLGVALIATGCSAGPAADTAAPTTITTLPPVSTATPATTAATTTSTSTTSTTTLVPEPQNPSAVNGLDVADPTLADRRAVAVKIDNHPKARPQSGLQEADMIYELLVEGGLTRFIAVFQQSDSLYVGPIRSLRPTDPTLVVYMDAPLQVSGGQDWIVGLARGRGLHIIGDDRISTYRVGSRRAPHNLYGDTEKMRSTADRRGWSDAAPESVFTFGTPPTAFLDASVVTLDWSDRPEVVWRWDTLTETYLRSNRDNAHDWISLDGERSQISTETLLVLTARKYTASPSSGEGSSVPALDTVGDGQALLFHRGDLIKGTWQRDTLRDRFSLQLPSGIEMVVPRGKLWVSIFPTSGNLEWE